jgi:hypothetical protein
MLYGDNHHLLKPLLIVDTRGQEELSHFPWVVRVSAKTWVDFLTGTRIRFQPSHFAKDSVDFCQTLAATPDQSAHATNISGDCLTCACSLVCRRVDPGIVDNYLGVQERERSTVMANLNRSKADRVQTDVNSYSVSLGDH